jgi:hypothetical protein
MVVGMHLSTCLVERVRVSHLRVYLDKDIYKKHGFVKMDIHIYYY